MSRSSSSFLLLLALISLLVFSSAASPSLLPPKGEKILVLLDDVAVKSSHSLYFAFLSSCGYDLYFKLSDDPSASLRHYSHYLYDGLILFCPSTERFGGSIDLEAILDFVDSGHDLIIAADANASELIKEIATKCGVDFDEDSSAMVVDHLSHVVSEYEGDHTLIVANDFIEADIIPGNKKIEAPVLFQGIGHSINPANSLVFKVLSASPAAYSANPNAKLSAPPSLSGSAISLVSVMQARNNARVLISGSLSMFSNRFFRSTVEQSGATIRHQKAGNEQFLTEISKWIFHERGHLQAVNVQHNKAGEVDEPAMYRINDDLTLIAMDTSFTGHEDGFCGGGDFMAVMPDENDVFVNLEEESGDLRISWGEDHETRTIVVDDDAHAVLSSPPLNDADVTMQTKENLSSVKQLCCTKNPNPSPSGPSNDDRGLIRVEIEREPMPQGDRAEWIRAESGAQRKERKKRVSWTEDEQKLFLMGVMVLGCKWSKIRKDFVLSKSSSQFGSHVQKFRKRNGQPIGDRKRHTVNDVRVDDITHGDIMRLAPKRWRKAVLTAMTARAKGRTTLAQHSPNTALQETASDRSAPTRRTGSSSALAGSYGSSIPVQQSLVPAVQESMTSPSALIGQPASSIAFARSTVGVMPVNKLTQEDYSHLAPHRQPPPATASLPASYCGLAPAQQPLLATMQETDASLSSSSMPWPALDNVWLSGCDGGPAPTWEQQTPSNISFTDAAPIQQRAAGSHSSSHLQPFPHLNATQWEYPTPMFYPEVDPRMRMTQLAAAIPEYNYRAPPMLWNNNMDFEPQMQHPSSINTEGFR